MRTEPITSNHLLCHDRLLDWKEANLDEVHYCRTFKSIEHRFCHPGRTARDLNRHVYAGAKLKHLIELPPLVMHDVIIQFHSDAAGLDLG